MWRESPDPGSRRSYSTCVPTKYRVHVSAVRRRFDGIPCRRDAQRPRVAQNRTIDVDVHRIDFRRRLDMDRGCRTSRSSRRAESARRTRRDEPRRRYHEYSHVGQRFGRRRIADAESAALALAAAGVRRRRQTSAWPQAANWTAARSLSAARAPTSGEPRCVSLRVRVDRSRHDDQVRVAIIGNTNAFAKAGLMIRESLNPASPHAVLDVRPTGDIEFMARTSSGATTTFVRGAFAPAPVWLRLVKAGTRSPPSVDGGQHATDTCAIGRARLSVTVQMANNFLLGNGPSRVMTRRC